MQGHCRGRIVELAATLFVLTVVVLGCSPPRQSKSVGEESPQASTKVAADAYLFDAVLVREGKTTSFRLEVYATDTIVGLAGRGYLGKGALRGVMGAKRLRVFFPSTNEFVDDGFEALLSDPTCPITFHNFNPIKFLNQLPDSVSPDTQITVVRTKSNENRAEYSVRSKCDWQLSLAYDRREVGWRPVEIKFVPGSGTSLRATRREFRPGTRVAANKFADPVPADAVPIAR